MTPTRVLQLSQEDLLREKTRNELDFIRGEIMIELIKEGMEADERKDTYLLFVQFLSHVKAKLS